MKRRDFLKAVGAVVVASSLPVPITPAAVPPLTEKALVEDGYLAGLGVGKTTMSTIQVWAFMEQGVGHRLRNWDGS